MLTVEKLKDYIRSKMESTEPQRTILRVMRERFTGKRFDKRVLAALREATGIQLRDVRHYGWTEIAWGPYGNAYTIMIARAEKNVYINPDWIEKENGRYYGALDERNARRQKSLNDEDGLSRLAEITNLFNTKAKELAEIKEQLDEVTKAVFCDRYDDFLDSDGRS